MKKNPAVFFMFVVLQQGVVLLKSGAGGQVNERVCVHP